MMGRMSCTAVRVLLYVPVLLIAGGVCTYGAWRVPEAPVRFELELTIAPSYDSAGWFVEIPDGGLLPSGSALRTQVFAGDGTALESYVLWHSAERSLALVLAHASGVRRAVVYVSPAPRYRLWTPDSGLSPGAILATDPTRSGLAAARLLAALGRVPGTVHYGQLPHSDRAPLHIPGDLTGRPRPAAFYLLAHLASSDPGRTWIAPFLQSGESEVRVNGSVLESHKRIEKWGGTGDWVEIRPGPNRLEILHSAPGVQPFTSTAQLFMTWRTPNASMAELGGVRSEAVPMAGTSRVETRVVQQREIMRSGTCTIRSAQTRTGAPAALIQYPPPMVFGFENETPLLVYAFETPGGTSPEDTVCTWRFANGISTVGRETSWIYPGFQEHQVTLTAASAAGQTVAVKPFYTYSARGANLNSGQDRRDFRRALLSMARAHPEAHPAVATWDPAYWRNLMRTLEFGKGYPLLLELFLRHRHAMAMRMTPLEIERLQDVFLDVAMRLNPRESLEWIKTFGETTADDGRRDELAATAAEVYMHCLGDYETAERLLRARARQEDSDGQRRLRIRLGDLALIQGDLNTATRYYAEAQNRARAQRNRQVAMTVSERLRQAAVRSQAGAEPEMPPRHDWRLRALRDAAASEAVRSLLNQGYGLEARQALRDWELNMPLSKISGDFILLEAMLYRTLPDPLRAIRMLQAFCDTGVSSNYLPEAAPLLLELMREAGESPEKIRRYAERFRETLEFHPAARDLERLIPRTPEVRKEAVPDD